MKKIIAISQPIIKYLSICCNIFLCCVSISWSFSNSKLSSAQPGGGALTFEQRVSYQRAIEEVYWRHRIWPKENKTPKPPLSTVMPETAIIAKVEDYLRKSDALENYWQRPVQPQHLQAEVERIIRGTKQPSVLREIFDSLDDNPYVIAECLARPILVDRLIQNIYAADERIHGTLKKQIESELITNNSVDSMKVLSGIYTETTWKKKTSTTTEVDPKEDSIMLDSQEWNEWIELLGQKFANTRVNPSALQLLTGPLSRSLNAVPVMKKSSLKEEADKFYVVAVLEKNQSQLRLATVEWKKQTFEDWWMVNKNQSRIDIAVPLFDYPSSELISESENCSDDTWRTGGTLVTNTPSSRYGHSAVWTGTEMIVWGGSGDNIFGDTGGRYNPSTDTWLPGGTSMTNAPGGRRYHTAVWTGTEMIIWGGETNTGGRYNPTTNMWAVGGTSMVDAPSSRVFHTAVWTGTEMIIWGGFDNGNSLNTGGRYNPSTDTWLTGGTSLLNAPSMRHQHTAIWTSAEMIIWGGEDGTGGANTGGRYNPSTDTWESVSTTNSPSGKYAHTAVWTGTQMIVWGGIGNGMSNIGGRYDPSNDTWALGGTEAANAPSSRFSHTAIWTGTEMIVWGGYDGSGQTGSANTGGRYDPSSDTWVVGGTPSTNAPSGRYLHTAIWTGSEMIIWGGRESASAPYVNSGGRYNPSTNSWVAGGTALMNAPSGRNSFTSVWTGTEMIVWGGYNGNYLNTGGRYDPSTDTWAPGGTSLSNAPSGRHSQTAIWTGSEMIIWGGCCSYNDGGRYNPLTNTWVSAGTSLINAPSSRYLHSAIWTGSEMIIWGGWPGAYTSTGGRYDPSNNTWAAAATSLVNAPSPRGFHTAVWTGTEMLIWGGVGNGPEGLPFSGGKYSPSTDTWFPSGTSLTNAPSGRYQHTGIWTGTEMIIWGGISGDNTGGRYNPSTDVWLSTTLANAPSSRYKHSAVWTGFEMIIWGGLCCDNTGGRYNPSTDTWLPSGTSLNNAPSARQGHSAIWNGNEMIIWGGYDGAYPNSGGQYCAVPPPSDTDSDGIPDDADNCPTTPNADQLDTDGDDLGNACDSDDDGDTCVDAVDQFPLIAHGDSDGDGLGDDCDTCPGDATNTCTSDFDGDGIANGIDNCPGFYNPTQEDSDNDGTGDVCDGISNDKIAFYSNREGSLAIYTMNPDGTNQIKVPGSFGANPSWSPNGTKIAFDGLVGGNYDVFLMNADGSNPIRLTTASGTDAQPSWSPDGNKLLFYTERDSTSQRNYEIYVMNSDGSNQTRLTNVLGDDVEADWSPDGTKIAFHTYRDGNCEIYLMNPDGSNQTNLTNTASQCEFSPAWSPDGKRIAFIKSIGSTSDVFVMNADGTGSLNITNSSNKGDYYPEWSPDGTKIAFMSYTVGIGTYDIYVMNADGSGVINLTNSNSFNDGYPSWRSVFTDVDTDGIPDGVDNCPTVSNADQLNTDADSFGDACDADDDNDTCADEVDQFPLVAHGDTDGDGLGDDCDACVNDLNNDQDGDGVCGEVDNCPSISNQDQLDSDVDGLGNACDPTPTGGLVAYWPADGDANDAVGSHNGTLFGGANFDSNNRKVGSASFRFNSFNDYVQVADEAALDITDAITIDAWIYIPSPFNKSGDQNSYVLDKKANYSLLIEPNRAVTFLLNYFTANPLELTTTDTFTLDQWHHVAATYDKTVGEAKVYIDGALKAQATYSQQIGTDDRSLRIGCFSAFVEGDGCLSAWNFPGLIDEVKLYNRALTAQEVNQDFLGSVAYWPADGDANDVVGPHDGTLFGGATFDSNNKKVGSASFKFSSANDYVQVADDPALDITDAITIAAWIYIPSPFNKSGDQNSYVLDKRNNYSLLIEPNGAVTFFLNYFANSLELTTADTISLDQWHHVAGTYDKVAAEAKVYIDGVVKAQASYSQPIGTDNRSLRIGCFSGFSEGDGCISAWNFPGWIDDVKLYNRALSSSEIIQDVGDIDSDADGIPDLIDNCPAVANSDQTNSDGDEFGNACDACTNDPDNDADEDNICGDLDNCPNDPNPDQQDADGDGSGDVCDATPYVSISISDVTLNETNGTTNANFVVTLSSASTVDVSVHYSTANGTANAGTDYNSTSNTLIIPHGTLTAPIVVPVIGDAVRELDETFFVNLDTPVNVTIADAQGLGTIVNDDATPAVSINDVSVTEGNSGSKTVTFIVSLSAPSTTSTTVSYATANGTATAPVDYNTKTGTITIAAGNTSNTFTVTTNGDVIDESDENFFVNLSNPINATIGDGQGVCTIVDDDVTPAISINDVSVTEGNSGSNMVTFTVSLDVVSTAATTVSYGTANGTAMEPGDYTSKTGSVTIPAGTTTKTFTVTTKADVIDESDEIFYVNLSNPINGTLADPQGICTIIDDDVTPAISINDVSVTEGNSGTKTVTFTVSLDVVSAGPTSVSYATADGTATAGADYNSKTGSISVPAGTLSNTFNVTIKGDTADEADETFVVNLNSPVNGTLVDSQGVCTILDND